MTVVYSQSLCLVDLLFVCPSVVTPVGTQRHIAVHAPLMYSTRRFHASYLHFTFFVCVPGHSSSGSWRCLNLDHVFVLAIGVGVLFAPSNVNEQRFKFIVLTEL